MPMIRDSQALLYLAPVYSEICQSGPVSRLGYLQKGYIYQACFESCLVPRMANPRSLSSLMPDDGALGTGEETRRGGRMKAESEAWPGGK